MFMMAQLENGDVQIVFLGSSDPPITIPAEEWQHMLAEVWDEARWVKVTSRDTPASPA